MNARSKFWNTGSGMAGLAVVICIAFAVNIIFGNLGLRKDLTEEKLYTLSEGTRQILKNLEEPLTLKFFFSSSAPDVPIPLKNYGQRVRDLLDEYQKASNGELTLQVFDPTPDSDEEEWAQKYGVSGQQMGFMGPTLYIGLVAVMGDVEVALPVLDPRSESLLEYNITRMITQVANPTKPVLGVLSSLPVMGTERPPYPMPNQPEPKPAWFAFQDLKKDYEVRNIDPSATTIDNDLDALVLVHPKNLSEPLQYAIDQFVLRGGRLLAFVDPMCVAEAETQTMPPMGGFPQRSSDMGRLLDAWHVTFDPGKVVADLESSSRISMGRNNQVEDSPVWLSLRRQNFNSEDVLTANIESIMLPFAGSLGAESSDEVTVTTLIASSETSDMADAMTAQFSSDGVRRAFNSGMTKLNLGIRLQGTFKTAFPEGKPAGAEDEGNDDAEPEDAGQDGLMESAQPTTIMLIGDADMLYDRFCVQEINFFGQTAHQPMNDNLSLVANAIEQLAGSTALSTIRTRGKTERPFDVVLDLQRKAQEKYMQEEMRLQQNLEQAQRRLGELQSSKDDQQRFFLSPQQQREITNFQQQVQKTKKELKLVRRKLRGDIERLGVKLKVLNILLMPALVGIGGVGFGIYRRKRTRD